MPAADQESIVVTICLKRRRLVSGRVLDHAGKGVNGAAVFAIGTRFLNIHSGKAWRLRGVDAAAKSVQTDEDGFFELHAGEAKNVAVSHPGLEVWATPLPKEGGLVIRLPAPARIEISYNIQGGSAKGEIFYQMLSHKTPGWALLESTRTVSIKNGGGLVLPAMTPGKYQIGRRKTNRVGQLGVGAILDREFLELKPGETKTIRFVRESGARLRGKITWPEGTKLAGIIVSVRSEDKKKDPFNGFESYTIYSSRTIAENGTFHTERISPGRYRLLAEAYAPLRIRANTGRTVPAYRVETTVDVPRSCEVVVPDLMLKKSQN